MISSSDHSQDVDLRRELDDDHLRFLSRDEFLRFHRARRCCEERDVGCSLDGCLQAESHEVIRTHDATVIVGGLG